ncbi:MAG: hypothetical protein ACK40S_09465 [Burkholderiaceae bacterium]
MATQSPFSFLDGLADRLAAGPQPPQWVVQEVQQRIVLLLNHVLMQEPEAMARLARQRGRVVSAQWRHFSMALLITPAGLFNRAAERVTPDLRLEIAESSPLALLEAVVRGDKPPVRIEGDVQLAAEINWLADHVRWDLEEDLARLMGDAPAHGLAQALRRAAQALRQFVGSRMPPAGGSQAPTVVPGDRTAP